MTSTSRPDRGMSYSAALTPPESRLARLIGPAPELTPFEQGQRAWAEGRTVPYPRPGDDYNTRLRNAGWQAARREEIRQLAERADAIDPRWYADFCAREGGDDELREFVRANDHEQDQQQVRTAHRGERQ